MITLVYWSKVIQCLFVDFYNIVIDCYLPPLSNCVSKYFCYIVLGSLRQCPNNRAYHFLVTAPVLLFTTISTCVFINNKYFFFFLFSNVTSYWTKHLLTSWRTHIRLLKVALSISTTLVIKNSNQFLTRIHFDSLLNLMLQIDPCMLKGLCT